MYQQYEIKFIRIKNGSVGTDHCMALSVEDAVECFNECYRHGLYIIDSVTLMN